MSKEPSSHELLQWFSGKGSACHRQRRLGFDPSWEDSLEKEMATRSSVLTWRIPWQRSLVGYIPLAREEWDTTEWLNNNNRKPRSQENSNSAQRKWLYNQSIPVRVPKKKKCKKGKMVVWGGFIIQIAERRRDEKSKWEKERYTHLNADFQRIARRNKKAFLKWSVERDRGKQ